MTRKERKFRAQDELLQGMANVILGEIETSNDQQMLDEMYKQAARVMKIFGVDQYPGLHKPA